MSDLYRTLGVDRSASQAEVKKSYRKLAKKLHPDRNPGDDAVAERFKEISAAYSVIGDKEQRARYDRGEIDSSGAQSNPFAGARAGAGGGGFAGFEDIIRGFSSAAGGGAGGPGSGARTFHFGTSGSGDDIFSQLFGGRGGGARPRQNRPGQPQANQPGGNQDVSYTLGVSFLDAVCGTTKRLTLRTGKTLDVKIPAGVNDGQQIRLSEQGDQSFPGVRAGDALIRVSVEPHSYFRREGKDILLDVPITVNEAVLGAKVNVPTISGKVKITVPKGTSSGTRLRLKGKGIKAGKAKPGDQIIELKITLPNKADPALEKAMKSWAGEHGYSVRGKFGLE